MAIVQVEIKKLQSYYINCNKYFNNLKTRNHFVFNVLNGIIKVLIFYFFILFI